MSAPQLQRFDLLVVGAGLSGLHAARQAMEEGIRTLVLDKGSRAGGRLATRPLNDHLADYGLQYFELHSAKAREQLRGWQREGIVKPWGIGFEGEPVGLSIPKHMVVGGMNQLPTRLAEGMDVRLRTEVTAISRNGDGWLVETREGKQYRCRGLVLTCPAPQSVTLLAGLGSTLDADAWQHLGAIRYHPCFALIAKLEGPSAIPCPGGLLHDGDPIAWIADNHQKGISGNSHLVTIHAGVRFSEQFFNQDPDRVARRLMEAAQPLLGASINSWHLHRWRYARPRIWNSAPSLTLAKDSTLVACGDAFGGDNVESALLSGLEGGSQISHVLRAG